MVLLIPSKKSAGNKNEKSTISTTSLEKVRRDQQRGDECCDIDGENKSEKCPLPLTYSGNHWSEYINENTISSREITESDNFLNKLKGGSDNNQFIYLDSDVFNDDGESSFKNSKFLNQFDIILEVKNFKISGYTFNDVVKLLEHLSKTDGFITLRTVKSQLSRLSHMNSESTTTKLLPLELNKFLEVSFRKDSIDHDLQQTIRDNVYERTVPCTTRPPRPGEVHGQDYVFLTNDEFVMLKNNSLLLEYGFYNGFMYGTPIPPPQPKPFNDKTNMCSKSLEINESKISGDQSGLISSFNASHNNSLQTESKINKSHNESRNYNNYTNSDFEKKIANAGQINFEELIKVSLYKTFHGLGFTIIGANEKNKDFLQIKHIVPDGAAAKDGRLRQGDILVYVNEQCVLGYTHQDVVEIFKSIPIGNWVELSITRGHPLSIDVNDPNIKILPLAAISNNKNSPLAPIVSFNSANDVDFYEEMFIRITKGANGFGFTIAEDTDSDYQKIKQIVNKERCINLNESDVLVEINEVDLNGMSHNKVVDILKSCVCEQEAIFKIKRKRPKPSKCSSSSSSTLGYQRIENNENNQQHGYENKKFQDQDNKIMNNEMNNPYENDNSSNDEVDLKIAHKKTSSVLSNPISSLNSSVHAKSQGLLTTTPLCANQNPIIPQHITFASKNHHQLQSAPFNPQLNSVDIYPNANRQTFQNNILTQQQNHISNLSTNRSKTPGPDMVYFRNEFSKFEDEEKELDLYIENSNTNQTQIQYNYPIRSKTPTAEMMSNNFEYSSSSNNFKNFASSSTMVKRKPFLAKQKEEIVSHWNQPDIFLNDFTIDDVKFDDYGNYFIEMNIELFKLESGFGFKIVGGKETDSQVSIGYIVYGGAAHMNNRLRPNDEIVMIDSECVLGATHKRVIQLMAIAGLNGKVKLRIKRKLSQQNYETLVKQRVNFENQRIQNIQQQHYQRKQQQQHQQLLLKQKNQPSYPFKITLFRNLGEEFGFIIVSPVDKNGVQLIGNILENSPAYQCNILNVGDRILALNDIDVSFMQNFEISKLIKETGNSITLTVEPKIAKNHENKRHSIYLNEASNILNILPDKNIHSPLLHSNRNSNSIHHKKLAAPIQNLQENRVNINHNKFHIIELYKFQTNGFGFSIRGGSEWNMPIYILKLAENGSAALDGRLEVGDQILEINGVDAFNMTHNEAKEHIKAGGNTLVLLVRRTGLPPPSMTEILSRTTINSRTISPQHQRDIKHFRSFGVLNEYNS